MQEGIVRIGTVAAIPALLEQFGMSPGKVLAEIDLDLKLFQDPDNQISQVTRSQLFNLCVERTGCPHFGLLVGQQAGLPSLGLVGYLAQNAPDVRSALHNLLDYFFLHAQGAAVTLITEGDAVFLGYNLYQPRIEAGSQIEDGAVAVIYNILHKLCGHEFAPLDVCFAHREPEELEPYLDFFQASLHFDAEKSGIHFSARYLDQQVPDADPELRRLLQKQIDKLVVTYSDNFPESVRRILFTAFLTNRATADHVAALFSMHSRTLHRRLKEFDTSFQELADKSRYEVARHLLEDSRLELIHIAEMLNYADVRSFSRAFKRWSGGTTPAQWRALKGTRKSAPLSS